MFVVQLRFARALLLALPLLVPLACNRSEAGEQVVVEPPPGLADGDRLRVRAGSPPAAG